MKNTDVLALKEFLIDLASDRAAVITKEQRDGLVNWSIALKPRKERAKNGYNISEASKARISTRQKERHAKARESILFILKVDGTEVLVGTWQQVINHLEIKNPIKFRELFHRKRDKHSVAFFEHYKLRGLLVNLELGYADGVAHRRKPKL